MWFGSGKSFWSHYKEVVLVDKWLEDLLCGNLAKETTDEDVGAIFQLCWEIWKARNNFVFNGKFPKPEEVIEQARRTNSDYLQAVFVGSVHGVPTPVRESRWKSPPPGVVKLNIDGAFKSSRSLAAFGILLELVVDQLFCGGVVVCRFLLL